MAWFPGRILPADLRTAWSVAGRRLDRPTWSRSAIDTPLQSRRQRHGSGPVRQRLLLLAVGAASAAFALLTMRAGMVVWEHHGLPIWLFAVVQPCGLMFMVAGLLIWYRRPSNRVGPLMIACGVTWYLGNLQGAANPVLQALGYWLLFLPAVVFGHLVLAFPGDRSLRRPERWLVLSGYVVYLTLQGIRYLLEGMAAPIGWFANEAEQPGSRLGDLISLVALAQTAVTAVMVVQRWRSARHTLRRQYGPIWVGVLLVGGLMAAMTVGAILGLDQATHLALLIMAGFVAAVVLPFAFVAGLWRVHLTRLRVPDLIRTLERSVDPAQLRDLLAKTLGDPELTIGFWAEERAGYLQLSGQPIELQRDQPARTATVVDRDGHRLAVLVHDSALVGDPLLADTVAAARLALDNARLHAVERAQMTRLVEAGLQERRRIERDLHDGIQHRLLYLIFLAKRARALGAERAAGADLLSLLDDLVRESTLSDQQLRDLTQGIHPAILTERGLAAAVEEHTARMPVPVRIDLSQAALPPGRWHAVEATAFFAVSEALTNATKYAHASVITIRGWHVDGRLVVEVSDDGVGGAMAGVGTGLQGIRDRVQALGGTVTVDSPPGQGTRVVVMLPCA